MYALFLYLLIYFYLFSFTLSQKATKKTDKPRTEEVEVTDLTDEDLKEQLAKHGVDSGPIVGECCLRLIQFKLYILDTKKIVVVGGFFFFMVYSEDTH